MRISFKLALAAAALGLALSAVVPAQAGILMHRDSDGVFSINPLLCLTDYDVRQVIAERGYTHIRLNAPIEAHIQIKAERAGATWLIDFNRCSNRIVGVQQIG